MQQERFESNTFEEMEKDYPVQSHVQNAKDITLGAEIESMIVGKDGSPIYQIDNKPANDVILNAIGNNGTGLQEYLESGVIGPELDSCQIEYRSPEPTNSSREIIEYLIQFHKSIEKMVQKFGYYLSYKPVPPQKFTPYPSNSERYKSIHEFLINTFGEEIRKCTNIIGLHVHTGTFSLEENLQILNASHRFIMEMCDEFNENTQRIEMYEKLVLAMTGQSAFPENYKDIQTFLKKAAQFGLKPKDVYFLIRPTVFGTTETRFHDSLNPEKDKEKLERILERHRQHIIQILFENML